MFRIRIHFIRIRIHCFVEQKWEKFTAEKKINNFFESITTIYLSLGLNKGRPRYRRSLQLSKRTSTLENKEFFNFFLLLWFICPPGSGSTDLIESGSNTDPDPKHWLQAITILVTKLQLCFIFVSSPNPHLPCTRAREVIPNTITRYGTTYSILYNYFLRPRCAFCFVTHFQMGGVPHSNSTAVPSVRHQTVFF